MKKHISIIGANSYIGRNLAVHLLTRNDYEISLFDRDTAHFDNLNDYQPLNLLDPDSLSNVDFSSDVFFFFTGLTGTEQGFDDANLYVDVNEKMLLCFLDAYRKRKSKGKIVFLSTRLIYKGAEVPLCEGAEKEFKTIYAINKFSCEQYLKMYGEMFHVEYCILRLCVPYGSTIDGARSYGTVGFFEQCARQGKPIPLYGDGSLRRTFTHMSDLCDILRLAAFHEACVQEIYNIGGQNLSLLQAAQAIGAPFGVGVEFVPWPAVALLLETGHTVFDSSKLDAILHHRYRTDFLGCADTI